CADFFNRRLARAFHHADTRCGSGKSGELRILNPGQAVLARTSLVAREDGELEARFRVGLPAGGRRIKGTAAATLLTQMLPEILFGSLLYHDDLEAPLRNHILAVEDAQALRAQLTQHNLVAF